MEVNVIKARQKSAVRIKHDEITQTTLKPVIPITLEFALVFLAKDRCWGDAKTFTVKKDLSYKEWENMSQRGHLSEYAKQKMGRKVGEGCN